MAVGPLLLALDLGTTSLAGCLLTPEGVRLAEARSANPQAVLGADVIRRLEAARAGHGEELQRLLVAGIDALLAELLQAAGAERAAIGRAAACANPAITCLLRRSDPAPILFPPHRLSDQRGAALDPASLGLQLPVPLYLFPLVSGYVGGDLVAFVYGQQVNERGISPLSAPAFFLDIGTNAEMALCDGERWWSTSVAAGPAFEGGGISCGMPASGGAIAGVSVDGDRLQLSVVGGGEPRGLCGSGLAEAVAAGLEGGLIDRSGRIVTPGEVPTNLARYLVPDGAAQAIILYRASRSSILLTQADVRAFQLAKGALLAGSNCLLARSGLQPSAVERVVVTGAFGLSLQAAVLKRVAMLPPAMVEKTSFVPAGALAGVAAVLLRSNGSDEAQRCADRLKPYPLSGTPAFEQAFLAGLDF